MWEKYKLPLLVAPGFGSCKTKGQFVTDLLWKCPKDWIYQRLSVYLPVCLSIHLPLDIFKEERIKCGANYFMFLLPHEVL